MRQAWHEVNHLPEAFDWLTRGSKKTRTLFVIMLCVLVLCLFTTTPNKILPNLCKGVARSKGFFNPARLRSRDSWDYCRGFLVSFMPFYNYSEQKSLLISARA